MARAEAAGARAALCEWVSSRSSAGDHAGSEAGLEFQEPGHVSGLAPVTRAEARPGAFLAEGPRSKDRVDLLSDPGLRKISRRRAPGSPYEVVFGRGVRPFDPGRRTLLAVRPGGGAGCHPLQTRRKRPRRFSGTRFFGPQMPIFGSRRAARGTPGAQPCSCGQGCPRSVPRCLVNRGPDPGRREFQEAGHDPGFVPLTCPGAGQARGGCQGRGRRAGPRGRGRMARAEAAGARAALCEWVSPRSSAGDHAGSEAGREFQEPGHDSGLAPVRSRVDGRARARFLCRGPRVTGCRTRDLEKFRRATWRAVDLGPPGAAWKSV